ncbi:GNAT family N-acetyltransferase [Streptomyces sp. NRRL WC-3742]|uniref:GNAT family N-acetyltransferase n=1 Tax=Streptomyces sp. NRRL WC-3742 TaxID=1463934 RepID=UPI0004C4B596|nr:GNAT family N-acetyltransferase [Streptomyces sp. NRRL WC-3742]
MSDIIDPYEIRVGVPDVATFRGLRTGSGMTDRPAEAVAAGLANTWYGVTVHHPEAGVVGMGRVVGDGGTVYQIADVCVLPEHQGRGLGGRIMAALVGALEERAVPGAYVSLIADGPADRLYARHGFVPTAPHSIGMHRLV